MGHSMTAAAVRLVVVFFVTFGAFATVHASTPNAVGTYTGTGQDTTSMCAPPEPGETEGFNVTFTVSAQTGGSFSAQGSLTFFNPLEVNNFNTSNNSIFADGSVSGDWSVTEADGSQSAGTYNGNLSGNTLTISFSGAEMSSPLCNIDGSFVVTRGGPIDPAATSGSGAITPTIFFATVGAAPGLTSTRLRTVFKAMAVGKTATGAVPVAGGFMLQTDSGLAAGDGSSYPWGAWASYSHSEYEDDFVSTAFDAERDNVTVGIDVSPWAQMIAGVSFGYENNDIDTTFNGGNMDSDMFTVAPYVGAVLSDTFSVDFSIGYADIDIEQFRTLAGARVNSNVEAERWFVAGNVNMGKTYGNWYVSGRAGLLYAKEVQDAFVESDGTPNPSRSFELGQLQIGGEVAYSLGTFEPYATATYQREYSRQKIVVAAGIPQPANDNDDVQVGAGLRWFGDSVTASLEWASVLGREDFDDNTVSVVIRAEF